MWVDGVEVGPDWVPDWADPASNPKPTAWDRVRGWGISYRPPDPFGRALLEADPVQRTVARILESASQDMAARERWEDAGGRAIAPLAVTASSGNQ